MPCKYCKQALPPGLWICGPCFTDDGAYPGNNKLGSRKDDLELSIAILSILDQGWSNGESALEPRFAANGTVLESNVFVNMRMQTIREGKHHHDLNRYQKVLSHGTKDLIKRLQAQAAAESSLRHSEEGLVKLVIGPYATACATAPAAVTPSQVMRELDDISAQTFDHPYQVQEGDVHFNRPRGDHLTTSRDAKDEEDFVAFEQTGRPAG